MGFKTTPRHQHSLVRMGGVVARASPIDISARDGVCQGKQIDVAVTRVGKWLLSLRVFGVRWLVCEMREDGLFVCC